MTELLRPHEIAQLRQAADAMGCDGKPDAGRLMHGLLDVYEDAEQAEFAHEAQTEKYERERNALRDVLEEAQGMLERIRSTAETASESDALERHGEIRLLAEEAIRDIAEVLAE